MKKYNYSSRLLSKCFILNFLMVFLSSCTADLDEDYTQSEYHSQNQANAITKAGGTQGLKAIDAGILAYLRDGEDGVTEFGLKAVDLGMDLRSNDIDMNTNTWYGGYNNYNNIVLNSTDTEFLWKFFYKVINKSNILINSIPAKDPTTEQLVFKYKSQTYRAIAYFYLLRIYQHTKAGNETEAVPLDFGKFESLPKSTVGQVKKQILDDLTQSYNGLKDYSRKSKEEIDAKVVAAYLARYYLTYENWLEAEKYAEVAMKVGGISVDVQHGFDELSLSEVIWGAQVTKTTSEVYRSFFSHASQINDGYSGWNHYKTVNSNLYDMIPKSDKRKTWFADKEYAPGTVLIPGTWGHYNITPKYTSLKFIAQPGPGQFIGDYIYLRNTEFYLVKAEALARQGKYALAQQVLFDLNSERDPKYVKSTKTGKGLIDEILLYRRIELWGDGVAFFDMARNGVGLNRKDGRKNLVMPGADLVIPAMDSKMIFQIPQKEVDVNPNF